MTGVFSNLIGQAASRDWDAALEPHSSEASEPVHCRILSAVICRLLILTRSHFECMNGGGLAKPRGLYVLMNSGRKRSLPTRVTLNFPLPPVQIRVALFLPVAELLVLRLCPCAVCQLWDGAESFSPAPDKQFTGWISPPLICACYLSCYETSGWIRRGEGTLSSLE